jgi:hypothetical protein
MHSLHRPRTGTHLAVALLSPQKPVPTAATRAFAYKDAEFIEYTCSQWSATCSAS